MRVRLPLVSLVTVGAVGAALLTGCAGEPEITPPKTNVSFKPAPTFTAPTPSATGPVNPGPGVIQWYGTGGETLLHELIFAARSVRSQHDAGKIIIDLGPLSARLEEARGYTVAYIPEQKTQDTWTKARERLASGMATVLNASGLGTSPADQEKAAEAAAIGWEEIGEGIQGLRETDDQLRALGCMPTKDPWN
ncbi:hypothetical protein [Streptomyces sp. NBC_00347]|uniref:hypothetical protein n=1 Tax=Streptomyces sp. NBC_00347 TaxID=2975721 RepID=UPI002259AAF0|nr:hypothetical protein [Streptomyces sp. NBC_00347]MCX5124542.1 hypothetical protein [Streptomyces sp. NBC_00347]